MEPIEDLLRRELRRSDTPPSMSQDIALARVRRVRRKRHTIAAGVAALLLGATALTTLSLPGSGGQTLGSEPQKNSVRLYNLVFTDADHGYALQRLCSTGVPASGLREECRMQLLATPDAGKTWQERALPDEAAIEAAVTDLFWEFNSAFHRSLMLWVDASGTLAVGGRDLRYWTTSDGGDTWHESPIPRPQIAQPGQFTVFGSDDKLVTLKNPPAWPNETLGAIYGVVAAKDGSVWVPGRSATGVYYVTHDLGETWQTGTLPDAIDIRWVATLDGQTVFTVYRDETRDRLVRSADGGKTWEEISGMPDSSLGGSRGLVLPNGDLLIINTTYAGTLMRLKAGSGTAEDIAAVPKEAQGNLLYTTGGVAVAFAGNDENSDPERRSAASTSTDYGFTWLPVPVVEQ